VSSWASASRRVERAAGAIVWLLGFLLALAAPNARVAAQSAALDATPLPPGLASVWRVDGRRLDASASAWSLAAFAPNGALVAVGDATGTRVYRASDGRVERMLPAASATSQQAFGLAISAAGHLALGRVGGVDVYAPEGRGPATTYHCRGVCGPVSALAFAPDGRWLAFQAGGRGTADSTPGIVAVVDVGARTLAAELEAATTRGGVRFTEQGRELFAASVTRVDESGTFGLRAWSSGDGWRRLRDVPGAAVPAGSVGPFAFTERLTAYSRAGQLEIRELASAALVWAAPLAPAGLDAAEGAPGMRVEHVAFDPAGRFVVSYESPTAGGGVGAIVFRSLHDGSAVAFYDVMGVGALAVAPDGRTFLYSTRAGRTYTVLARVPL
jgi:hypothetical protein